MLGFHYEAEIDYSTGEPTVIVTSYEVIKQHGDFCYVLKTEDGELVTTHCLMTKEEALATLLKEKEVEAKLFVRDKLNALSQEIVGKYTTSALIKAHIYILGGRDV